ncbi:MAG: hypothetical protein KC438_15875, partial [Thermomicrobiales bacterium]|nr:hypothetical protein [Thermomicrobiales bacterium]
MTGIVEQHRHHGAVIPRYLSDEKRVVLRTGGIEPARELLRLVIPEIPIPGQCAFSFFFNDTATPEIFTLPLHGALPV